MIVATRSAMEWPSRRVWPKRPDRTSTLGRLEIATDVAAAADGKIPFYVHYADPPGRTQKFVFIPAHPRAHRGPSHRVRASAPGKGAPRPVQSVERRGDASCDRRRQDHLPRFRSWEQCRREPPSRTVAAKVVDEAGAPVAGATVVIDGYQLGEHTAGLAPVFPSPGRPNCGQTAREWPPSITRQRFADPMT